MGQRFTDMLRETTQPVWAQATKHRFVNELFNGTISDKVMGSYLVQDHRFLDSFLMLCGAAICTADTFAARLRFGRFVGMISSDEDTYFLRSFEALSISESQRASIADAEPTIGFNAIMREAAHTRSYAAVLAVLTVSEWLYLDWAKDAPLERPENFIHHEWITLHDNAEFREFVEFLRSELDRVGPAEEKVSKDFFKRAVKLELDFFDESYAN